LILRLILMKVMQLTPRFIQIKSGTTSASHPPCKNSWLPEHVRKLYGKSREGLEEYFRVAIQTSVLSYTSSFNKYVRDMTTSFSLVLLSYRRVLPGSLSKLPVRYPNLCYFKYLCCVTCFCISWVHLIRFHIVMQILKYYYQSKFVRDRCYGKPVYIFAWYIKVNESLLPNGHLCLFEDFCVCLKM
jgi:hypothetical protein